MKKTLIKIAALLGAAMLMTGCYEQVPAGTKGKIMGGTGFQPEVYPPSKIWLSNNPWNVVKEKMFLMQTTTKKFNERIQVKLSKEKLNVTVPVFFIGRIKGSNEVINTLFNDLPMNDNIVTVDEVYAVYAKQTILSTARDVISKYNVDELPQNYGRITAEIYNAVKPKLVGVPFEMSDVMIGNIDFPPVVEKAIEIATQKRMAIEEEDAKVQIELTKAKGREEVAKAQYRIQMIEAKQIRDYNRLTAEGITDDLLALKQIELRKQELDKWNGVLPTTLMTSGKDSGVPVIINSK